MVADTQAIDLLQELENRNIGLVDNQDIADAGMADVGSLLGAQPNTETLIFEQLLPALPQANETPENTQIPTYNPVSGMDLS